MQTMHLLPGGIYLAVAEENDSLKGDSNLNLLWQIAGWEVLQSTTEEVGASLAAHIEKDHPQAVIIYVGDFAKEVSSLAEVSRANSLMPNSRSRRACG